MDTKRTTRPLSLMLLPLLLPLFAGCMTAQEHYQKTHGAKEKEMTVGVVQSEIRIGMSAADVAAALGSPNIVTTDEQMREVWVYDKISTDVTYSKSSGGAGVALLVGGPVGSGVAGGLGSGSYEHSAGAKSTTQRTLTVIIKYDEQKLVRDFAYHATKF